MEQKHMFWRLKGPLGLIIVTVIALIILGGAAFYFLLPIQKEIKTLIAEKETITTYIQLQQEHATRREALEDPENLIGAEQLNKIPFAKEIPTFLQQLTTSAREANITIHALTIHETSPQAHSLLYYFSAQLYNLGVNDKGINAEKMSEELTELLLTNPREFVNQQIDVAQGAYEQFEQERSGGADYIQDLANRILNTIEEEENDLLTISEHLPFSIIPMTLTLSGNLDEVKQFVALVEGLPRIAHVENWHYGPRENTMTGTATQNMTELNLLIFYYKDEINIDK